MNLKQRIEAFTKLGTFFTNHVNTKFNASETKIHQGFDEVIVSASLYNAWFTKENSLLALKSYSLYLNQKELSQFITHDLQKTPKTIAVIAAGNIPMVCFHDILCVLLSGNKLLLKLSSDDTILLPFVLKTLVYFEPEFEKQILFANNKLSNFDAVIATGSNNTSRYLNYYFSKYPNIIRKSRTSVAVLDGNENETDLKNLGHDIFSYFGLGCRNVSKLLVPKDYNFNLFFEAIHGFSDVINSKKYSSNYDYYRAIYLLEREEFLDNNFLILKQNSSLHSPVAVMFYQNYSSQEDIESYLLENKDQIQCVVGKNYIPFGYSQQPVITDFADNVNTLSFLLNL